MPPLDLLLVDEEVAEEVADTGVNLMPLDVLLFSPLEEGDNETGVKLMGGKGRGVDDLDRISISLNMLETLPFF